MVGGGNSAGQAAVFLAQSVKRVHMLVRAAGWQTRCRATSFAASRRTPRSSCARIRKSRALTGTAIRERVRWRDNRPDAVETHDIRHAFIMTGAVPNQHPIACSL